MLDYNPTPNFHKKSEILRISETSVRFAAPSSAIKLKMWKTINGTIMLSINNPMQFNLSGKYPIRCLASVDPSVIGESLSCYCYLNN